MSAATRPPLFRSGGGRLSFHLCLRVPGGGGFMASHCNRQQEQLESVLETISSLEGVGCSFPSRYSLLASEMLPCDCASVQEGLV